MINGNFDIFHDNDDLPNCLHVLFQSGVQRCSCCRLSSDKICNAGDFLDNGDNSEDDPRNDSWNPTISKQNIPRFQRQRRSASLLEQSNQAPDEILI